MCEKPPMREKNLLFPILRGRGKKKLVIKGILGMKKIFDFKI